LSSSPNITAKTDPLCAVSVDFVVRNICPPTFSFIQSSAILLGGDEFDEPTFLESDAETSAATLGGRGRLRFGSVTPSDKILRLSA